MPEQPVPQFDRFAKLHEHAQRLGHEMTALIAGAYAEGVKDGLDLAAQMCDAAANATRELPIITAPHCAQIAMAEWLRDQARLMAHQIPDPEVPQ